MSTLSLMTRVRAFFGGKQDDSADAVCPGGVWPSGGGTLTLVGAPVGHDTSAGQSPGGAARRPAPLHAPAPDPAGKPPVPGDNGNGKRPRIDPIDPPWVDQIASLDDVGRQLERTRDTGQALLESVRQLPELASEGNDRLGQTNRLLQRQNTLLGGVCDGIGGLRASMQTMDESARRHLKAINQLETCHRQVLLGYQRMLVDSHRRLGRLAALAAVLASLAIGGTAWVAYLVLSAG